MFVTVRGLVIRSVQYKEADRMLTVLTDKLGRVSVKARGVSRKNSPLASGAQLFCCSDMVLFEKDGRYTLNELTVVEQFEGLRADIQSMALASYFADVLSFGEEEAAAEENSELLRLALNCLYALSSGKYPHSAVKAAFELRYLTVNGYAPDFDFCHNCGEELEKGTAIAEKGEIYCENCHAPYGTILQEDAISSARHFTTCDLRKLLQVSLSAASAESLSQFSEKYLRACLERHFKTLDFYNGLLSYRV